MLVVVVETLPVVAELGKAVLVDVVDAEVWSALRSVIPVSFYPVPMLSNLLFSVDVCQLCFVYVSRLRLTPVIC